MSLSCASCGAPTIGRRWRCESCRKTLKRARERARGYRRATPTQRGYGTEHKRQRRIWAQRVALGGVPCARCGGLIDPNASWDLGHADHDRSQYTGPEHRSCNRSAGNRSIKRRNGFRSFSRVW